jgi:molybdate transport system ATP-binding protein
MTLELTASVQTRGIDVSFHLDDGEVVALLGPNGAGKSSILDVIAGLLRPDTGRVVIDGRTLTEVGQNGTSTFVAPHERQVALLAQEALLFPHLTVRDNVAFGPRSRGASRHAARSAAQHWLGEVDALDLADRRPSQLSGGQAQRVAVARALAADPHLLLLDEPLAALDVAVTPALRQTLRRVLAHRAAIVVTHNVLDALLLTERVIVLDHGLVVEDGPSGDVLARPRSDFAAKIAGLNLVRGLWRDGAVHTNTGVRVEGQVTDPTPDQGSAVVAVFRPNAVSIFRTPPGGSPRNALAVTVTDLEPHGDQFRVRAADLSADITAHAAAELDLTPGADVLFTVKATEVAVYRT